MSNDIVWSVIRNNSAFIVKKRNCPKPFSTEPMNLTNRHSKRYSGLANTKAVGVADNAKGGFNLSVKKTSSPNKPRSLVKTTLMKAGPRTSLHKVKGLIVKQRYRKDLSKAAMRRAAAYLRSQKPLPAHRKGAKAKVSGSKKTE